MRPAERKQAGFESRDLKAAIVGTGELEDECRQLCRELGIQDNVQFLGFQSNPMKMVSCSKALVLTSRWEGTPMCALEAMALGTPVVSTPSDGMKDLLTDGVSGFLSQDDQVLAQDLLEMMQQSSLNAGQRWRLRPRNILTKSTMPTPTTSASRRVTARE